MGQHLVFYDGKCGFCDHVVQIILRQDNRKIFDFAPLQGSTAKKLLKDLPPEMKTEDSLVLIENYKDPSRHYYILGKGAFRISWLLGGVWAIPGVISWLPSFLYDWGYRLVAKNRSYFNFDDKCVLPTREERERFLP